MSVPKTLRLPRLVVTAKLLPLSTRRAAAGPPGAFKGVMSTMRKRRRVTDWPVAFLKRRRMSSVPSGQFDGALPPLQTFGVVSRTRLGASDEDCCGSMRLAFAVALGWIGLDRFSGAGAPSCVCAAPKSAPVGETKAKSLALSPVSCGVPDAGLRIQLYAPSFAPAEVKPVPSRKRSAVAPASALKPTASSRCASVKLAGVLVLKRATPVLSGRSSASLGFGLYARSAGGVVPA